MTHDHDQRRKLAATLLDPRIGAYAVVLLPTPGADAGPLEVYGVHAPEALAGQLDGALRRLRAEVREAQAEALAERRDAGLRGEVHCPRCGVVDAAHDCGDAYEVEIPAWRAERRVYADGPELAAATAAEEIADERADEDLDLDSDEDGVQALVTGPDGLTIPVLIRAEMSLDFVAERMHAGGGMLQ